MKIIFLFSITDIMTFNLNNKIDLYFDTLWKNSAVILDSITDVSKKVLC